MGAQIISRTEARIKTTDKQQGVRMQLKRSKTEAAKSHDKFWEDRFLTVEWEHGRREGT